MMATDNAQALTLLFKFHVPLLCFHPLPHGVMYSDDTYSTVNAEGTLT